MAQEVTNFARFYGILKERFTFASKELGEEFKESLVSQFTNGRTTSLREMSLEEYDEMCDRLDGPTALIRKSIEAEHRRLRSRCLRQMQQLALTQPTGLASTPSARTLASVASRSGS